MPKLSKVIKDVVILGGGTAGWMTAAYLARHLQDSARITLLESPAIGTIGVGEATLPNLQRIFFDYLGIAEKDWMRECNASFKTAVKFVNWRSPGRATPRPRFFNGSADVFYHPFGILPDCDRIPLSHYWLLKKHLAATSEAYDYACFKEPHCMDAKRAPCWPDGRPATRYAWHFDAHLVADFLRRFAVETQRVVHVQDELESVGFDHDGFIKHVSTKGGMKLSGELFIDCSGFRGLLINKALDEPFVDMSDQLLCDSAVCCPIAHDRSIREIEPYTSAIAMESGWTWKTPMLLRFGTGYVYSSKFASDETALRDFCHLWKLDPEQTRLNKIRFRVGRNRRAWVKNCVSIGLSSCFLEPLESTGIYFICASLYQLAKHFPDTNCDQRLVNRFNREIETMFDDCRDFIQAHFYLAPRNDTPFWRANKELTLSEALKEKMETYKAGLPVNPPFVDEHTYYNNFDAEFRNFWTNGSYYCIFAGLGFLPDRPLPILAHKPESCARAEQMFIRIKQEKDALVRSLPSHYAALLRLHGPTDENATPLSNSGCRASRGTGK